MHFKCPCMGLGFYVNPPVLAPIVPGRGVVRHYIDRCITDLLEYSSILCAISIKKQPIAVPEHKPRRPKILEVSICAFSTEILWIFYCDIYET